MSIIGRLTLDVTGKVLKGDEYIPNIKFSPSPQEESEWIYCCRDSASEGTPAEFPLLESLALAPLMNKTCPQVRSIDRFIRLNALIPKEYRLLDKNNMCTLATGLGLQDTSSTWMVQLDIPRFRLGKKCSFNSPVFTRDQMKVCVEIA